MLSKHCDNTYEEVRNLYNDNGQCYLSQEAEKTTGGSRLKFREYKSSGKRDDTYPKGLQKVEEESKPSDYDIDKEFQEVMEEISIIDTSDESARLKCMSAGMDTSVFSGTDANEDDGKSSKRDIYIPKGTEYVRADHELPRPDNTRSMPSSSGIIYEIAEELYTRERTAAELEALCQPPFKKIFDDKQIEKMNQQAEEKKNHLIEAVRLSETQGQDKATENKKTRSISTASAFVLQLLLFIPLVNIITAVILSFSKSTNVNTRSYTRAFIIWCVLFMIAALSLFVYLFITNTTLDILRTDQDLHIPWF